MEHYAVPIKWSGHPKRYTIFIVCLLLALFEWYISNFINDETKKINTIIINRIVNDLIVINIKMASNKNRTGECHCNVCVDSMVGTIEHTSKQSEPWCFHRTQACYI